MVPVSACKQSKMYTSFHCETVAFDKWATACRENISLPELLVAVKNGRNEKDLTKQAFQLT